MKKKAGGFFDCQGWKVHKSGKREIIARVLPGTLLVLFFYFFGIPVYLPL